MARDFDILNYSNSSMQGFRTCRAVLLLGANLRAAELYCCNQCKHSRSSIAQRLTATHAHISEACEGLCMSCPRNACTANAWRLLLGCSAGKTRRCAPVLLPGSSNRSGMVPAGKLMAFDTMTSPCKDTECKNILDVRTVQLATEYRILTATAPMSKDNSM